MNTVNRYDVEAGKNILEYLRQNHPQEYAALMAKLQNNAGLGTAQPVSSGSFLDRIFDIGANALETIATHRLDTIVNGEANRQAEQDFDNFVQQEMQRQALLAAQAETQALEFQNQLALREQTAALEAAAQSSRNKLNTALFAVAGLVGLFLLVQVIK